MMHQNSFVACIKSNGKILREQDGEVRLPFGAEYSILLKNINSVRALAKISVDGQDVTQGTKLIVPANNTIELERYIVNGNMNEGNRFKFIERTAAVEAHKGIGSDDGLVRVEFWKEIVYNQVPYIFNYPVHPPSAPWERRRPRSGDLRRSRRSSDNFSLGVRGQALYKSSSMDVNTTPTGGAAAAAPANETGVTAPGSISGQHFVDGDWFATETSSTVLVLHLKGAVAGARITKPVTVERKLDCSSCGLKNSSIHSYCSRCGTALNLVY